MLELAAGGYMVRINPRSTVQGVAMRITKTTIGH